jgi:spoIIIJ-associated protein
MADKKFSPMRYTASSEEAAVNGALQIVGASRDEIEFEVLEQSAKGVTVRVRPRSSETPIIAAPVEESLEESSPIAEDVPELLAQSDEADARTEETEPESEIEAQLGEALDSLAADFADETPDFESEAEGETARAEPVEAAPEIAALDPEIVARAQQKAQQMLDKMGLEAQAQVDVAKEAGVAALVIEGEDVGILIGKHGATLQSFQYLLNLTLNAHLEGEEARRNGARVVVDAGNYRARRASSLEQIARGAASKVRRDGRLVRLEPMPAHERRLVHMFLQTEADIVTQSEGREPMRRIVVSPPVLGGNPAPAKSEPVRAERAPSGGGRSGFGSFRRGDAQSERNRGLQGRR